METNGVGSGSHHAHAFFKLTPGRNLRNGSPRHLGERMGTMIPRMKPKVRSEEDEDHSLEVCTNAVVAGEVGTNNFGS